MSKKTLEIKRAESKSLFALDFQNRMCQLRERAKTEGFQWIEDSKNKKSIISIKEKILFKEFSIQADLSARVYLLKEYSKKNGEGKLYRFKIEANYQMKSTKEKVPFYYYITLSE